MLKIYHNDKNSVRLRATEIPKQYYLNKIKMSSSLKNSETSTRENSDDLQISEVFSQNKASIPESKRTTQVLSNICILELAGQ